MKVAMESKTAVHNGNGLEASSIPLFKVFMPASVMEPLRETLLSGYIGQGARVDEFEAKLSEWFHDPMQSHYPNVLTLNSCTSALQLALRLANVGHGDFVISSSMSCLATNTAIRAVGAHPQWADINPRNGNIDPESVHKRITAKTKAIMVVHWGGYPVDLYEINAIAHEYGIPVIEDAAHAMGSIYQGVKIGNHSQFVAFSFQAIKHMTTVDGGALLCRRREDYERGKLLRWYGINREGNRKDFRCEEDVAEAGFKYHMNDVNATIGIEQLKHVDYVIEAHRSNAAYYDKELAGLESVKLLDYKADRLSSYWLYSILVENKPKFYEYMKGMGITVSQVHARNDLHTLFKDYRVDLPGVTEFVSKLCCIPCGWWVSRNDRERIAKAIKSYRP